MVILLTCAFFVVFFPPSLIKFLPHSGDRILVTGAADTKVHVHDVSVKETIHMFSDHTNRVKRIATAPMWPNTFWSAAEDGTIRFDRRGRRRRFTELTPTSVCLTLCLFATDSMIYGRAANALRY